MIYFLTFFFLSYWKVQNHNVTYYNMSENAFFNLENLNQFIDKENININLIEAGVYHKCNSFRLSKNIKVCNFNRQLYNAAKLHSKQMSTYQFFSHKNYKNKQFFRLSDRAHFYNYKNAVTLRENIQMAQVCTYSKKTYLELINDIFEEFLKSKLHQENILSTDVCDMACAISIGVKDPSQCLSFYFTQDFGCSIVRYEN